MTARRKSEFKITVYFLYGNIANGIINLRYAVRSLYRKGKVFVSIVNLTRRINRNRNPAPVAVGFAVQMAEVVT